MASAFKVRYWASDGHRECPYLPQFSWQLYRGVPGSGRSWRAARRMDSGNSQSPCERELRGLAAARVAVKARREVKEKRILMEVRGWKEPA